MQVDYETGNIPIPRSKYEENKDKPDFDKLRSEAEYLAAEKSRKMMPRGSKTPVAKIMELTKRTEGSLRQKALKLGISLGHRR